MISRPIKMVHKLFWGNQKPAKSEYKTINRISGNSKRVFEDISSISWTVKRIFKVVTAKNISIESLNYALFMYKKVVKGCYYDKKTCLKHTSFYFCDQMPDIME